MACDRCAYGILRLLPARCRRSRHRHRRRWWMMMTLYISLVYLRFVQFSLHCVSTKNKIQSLPRPHATSRHTHTHSNPLRMNQILWVWYIQKEKVIFDIISFFFHSIVRSFFLIRIRFEFVFFGWSWLDSWSWLWLWPDRLAYGDQSVLLPFNDSVFAISREWVSALSHFCDASTANGRE